MSFERLADEYPWRLAAAERDVVEWRWSKHEGLAHREIPRADEIFEEPPPPVRFLRRPPARPMSERHFGFDADGRVLVERRYAFGHVNVEIVVERDEATTRVIQFAHSVVGDPERGQVQIVPEHVWTCFHEDRRVEFHDRGGPRRVL